MREIILASASPRRRELMELAGLDFTVLPAESEERSEQKEPGAMVTDLSRHKSLEVFRKRPDAVVIGADTVVSCCGEVLGKPTDRADARRMIGMIAGRSHDVFTGVTICFRNENGTDTVHSFYEQTKVHVYPMTEEEINGYIDTAEPYDKAGAYAVQGHFMRYISGIEGDYYNVVGLPAARLCRELKSLGMIS